MGVDVSDGMADEGPASTVVQGPAKLGYLQCTGTMPKWTHLPEGSTMQLLSSIVKDIRNESQT